MNSVNCPTIYMDSLMKWISLSVGLSKKCISTAATMVNLDLYLQRPTTNSAGLMFPKPSLGFTRNPASSSRLVHPIVGWINFSTILSCNDFVKKTLQRFGFTLFTNKNHATGEKVQNNGQIAMSLSNGNFVYG